MKKFTVLAEGYPSGEFPTQAEADAEAAELRSRYPDAQIEVEAGPEIPHVYVLGSGSSREQVERYLGFGATIIRYAVRDLGGVVCVIQVPKEHAKWLSMRLASGLAGGQTFESLDELREDYNWHATH